MPPDRNAARIHRIGPLLPLLAEQQAEQLVDVRQPPLMIEAAEIFRVAEPPFDLGGTEPRLKRLIGRRAAQVGGERLVSLLRGSDDWPVRNQVPHSSWLALRHDIALEALPLHRLIFRDRPHGLALAVLPPLR